MINDFDYPLPRDKHDTENAAALVALGWEKAMPVMPEIMEWTQDMNWPVARVFQPFLVATGAPLAPFIKTLLGRDDDVWKYFILDGIVAKSSRLARALHADLVRLSNNPSSGEESEGVAELAREILSGKHAD